jgi:glutathione synthase/RimK-type ligase-like ATP-grasp enzyme
MHPRNGRPVKHVLLVGSAVDPHVQAITRLCERAGAECTLTSEDSLVSIAFDAAGPGGAASPEAEPTGVWWRVKPGFFRVEEHNSRNMFMRREWQHVLEAFELIYAQANWVNPREVDRRVRHKPNQLGMAQACGLHIPPTLISNDPQRVQEFVAAQTGRQAVFKPLSWFSERPDRQLFTNVVDIETIRANPDAIRRAPGIFQAVIPKVYELRITVVQRSIFAVRIDSQARPETRIDWRRNQLELRYDAFTSLPPRLSEALLDFHARNRLVFGAYDFIVTPDGDFVFLEVNPVGQWLWLEDATGVQISAAVAQALLGVSV